MCGWVRLERPVRTVAALVGRLAWALVASPSAEPEGASPFRVYFACVGNSGRSQMAEALCREMSTDAVECASGGSDPYGEVLDHVRTAMAEIGISMLGYESTPLDPSFVEEADLVVTMGCGEDACPGFRDVELVDWELRDPKGEDLATVREIRDEIGRRVRALLKERGVLA